MQNLTDEIKDLLLTRSLLLQRVSNSLTKDIINAYVSVIDDILAQIATGKNINLVNMNKIINELNAKLSPDLTSVNDDLVQLGISEASYIANGINGAIGIDLVSKLPTDRTVQKIVNTSLMDGLTISEWLGKQDKSFQETLTKQIRLGVIEGETNPQIVSRLKTALDIKNNNNVRTIVRTAVATITGQVREQTYKENEDIFKGWEWNATLDGRTRKEHAIYDGSYWDFEGNGLNDKGKANPFKKAGTEWNCRCILLPITKSFKELGIPLDEIPKGTRSSMDGYVSRDTTFEQWFEGKPKSFQEEYLGKSRYELYKKGTITFSDLVNQNGKVLKVSELVKISPIAKASNIPTIDFGYDGKFNKYVENIRDEAKIVIDKLPKPNNIEYISNTSRAGTYLSDTKILKPKKNDINNFHHEYGHHIDNSIKKEIVRAGGRIKIQPVMSDDERYVNAFNKDKVQFIGASPERLKKAIEDFGYDSKSKQGFGYSDILDSMSGGDVLKLKYAGHGKDYWDKSKNMDMKESFANLFQMWSQNGKEWENIKKTLPNVSKEFENIMKEVIDGKFD